VARRLLNTICMRWLVVMLCACTPDTLAIDVHVSAANADLPGATVAVTADSYEGADVTDDAGLAHIKVFDHVDVTTGLLTVSKPGFVAVQQMVTDDDPIEITLVVPP